MNMERNAASTATLALTVVFFPSIMFFLLDVSASMIHLWALLFLLLSEVALVCVVARVRYFNERKGMSLPLHGIRIVLTIYFLLTFAICFFADDYADRVREFLWTEFGIIVLTLIASIILFSLSKALKLRKSLET